jgi:hypothetical protein
MTLRLSGRLLVLICAAGAMYSQEKAAVPTVQTYTLSFESGVVMKSGDVKPMARQDFYLLNRSLTEIELEWDLYFKARFGPGSTAKKTGAPVEEGVRAVATGLMLKTAMLACPTTDKALAPFCPQLDAFRKYVVASTVTDFSGKGRFTVPAGTYYLYSYGSVGNSDIAWNVKVDLTSDKAVILDNRNAAGIF